jgi:uncharacterized protein (TIGR03083 family)
MDDVWAMVAQQRVELAGALDDVGPREWATDSLCEGWSVHDVLAHLVWLAELSRPRMLAETTAAALRHRCSPLTAMVPIARLIAERTAPGDLLDRLREARDGRFVVPGAPPSAALAEVLVHGLDMTRPLGRPDVVDAERAGLAVNGLRRFAAVYGVARPVRAMTLTSTSGWSSAGSGGPELVAGDGDLLLVVAGRSDPAVAAAG